MRSDDVDGNENFKKAIGLMSKATISHVQHAFLYISLPLRHDYDVKCLHALQRKYTSDNEISSLFFNVDMVLRDSTLGGFTYI